MKIEAGKKYLTRDGEDSDDPQETSNSEAT